MAAHSARSSMHSLRSPLPLLGIGIAVALVLIIVATLVQRQPGPDLSRAETLSEQEAITLVAQDMRSSQAALQVATQGSARYADGSWFVTVGDAHFRFSERNRIILPLDEAARQLEYGS